jgi:CTP-dependent riboflavin kinase
MLRIGWRVNSHRSAVPGSRQQTRRRLGALPGTANVQVSKRRTRANRGHVEVCLFVFTETVRNERAYGGHRLPSLGTRGCNGDGHS